MDQKSTYFPVLDGIRGIAALLVVLRHTEIFFAPINFQESYLAVDLFFLLSGIVLCRSYERRLRTDLSSRRFIVLRAIRLYPLYALGTLVGLLCAILVSSAPARTIAFAIVMLPDVNLHHRALYPFDGPAWTLALEAAASVAYGLVGFRLATRTLWHVIVASLLLLLVTLVAMPEHNLDLGWLSLTLIGGILRLTFSFTLGLAIARSMEAPWAAEAMQLGRSFGSSNLAAAAIFVAVCAILTAMPGQSSRWLYDIAAVGIIFPCIIALSLVIQLGSSMTAICKWLGLVSFPVYALHAPLGTLIVTGFRDLGIDVGHYAPYGGVIFLAVLIILAVVIDRIYDRPLRKHLTALSKTPTTERRQETPVRI